MWFWAVIWFLSAVIVYFIGYRIGWASGAQDYRHALMLALAELEFPGTEAEPVLQVAPFDQENYIGGA